MCKEGGDGLSGRVRGRGNEGCKVGGCCAAMEEAGLRRGGWREVREDGWMGLQVKRVQGRNKVRSRTLIINSLQLIDELSWTLHGAPAPFIQIIPSANVAEFFIFMSGTLTESIVTFNLLAISDVIFRPVRFKLFV